MEEVKCSEEMYYTTRCVRCVDKEPSCQRKDHEPNCYYAIVCWVCEKLIIDHKDYPESSIDDLTVTCEFCGTHLHTECRKSRPVINGVSYPDLRMWCGKCTYKKID